MLRVNVKRSEQPSELGINVRFGEVLPVLQSDDNKKQMLLPNPLISYEELSSFSPIAWNA